MSTGDQLPPEQARLQALVDCLLEHGFTLKGIAEAVGVSHKSLWNWYRGRRRCRNPAVVVSALELLHEANSLILTDEYYSRTHGGAVENFFSFKPDEPYAVKRLLGDLTYVGAVLELSRELLDEAAYMIRKYLKFDGGSVKPYRKPYVRGVVLAAIRVACLKMGRPVLPAHKARLFNHFLEEVERQLPGFFDSVFSKLSLLFLKSPAV